MNLSFMRNAMQKKAAVLAVMIFLILLYFLIFDSMVDLTWNNHSKRSSRYTTNLNYSNLISYNSYILKNPIYANFSIKPNQSRKRVNLLVIVTSAPSRIERRNAIRDTWWKSCQNNTKVYVYIFTVIWNIQNLMLIRSRVQSNIYQYKVRKEMLEKCVFRVNNKDTRTISTMSFLCLYV